MRAQGTGTIVNISSVAGRLAPVPTQGAYAASKHALCAFTDTLVAECSPFGIRAFCIEPGFFATSIMEGVTDELQADDPYKPVSDAIGEFFRGSVAAAPTPEAVAELVVAAAQGTLGGGVHFPVGVVGLEPTETSGRTG